MSSRKFVITRYLGGAYPALVGAAALVCWTGVGQGTDARFALQMFESPKHRNASGLSCAKQERVGFKPRDACLQVEKSPWLPAAREPRVEREPAREKVGAPKRAN